MSGRKQFDVDDAVERSMRAFWSTGYADTSLDILTRVTGLGRGSLYGAFGGKNGLFLRALDRYGDLYGQRYDAALARHPHDPTKAVAAYFDVVLDRLADPGVPDGCLVAMAAAQAGTLEPDARKRVTAALNAQRQRLIDALRVRGINARRSSELASFLVAVTQALAVLSRAGSEPRELRAIVRTTIRAVADGIGAES